MNFRPPKKSDIKHLVQMEQLAHADPDFGADFCLPHAWEGKDFIRALSLRRSKLLGTWETRAWVLEQQTVVLTQKGTNEVLPLLLAYFVYEIRPHGHMHVLNINARADHPEWDRWMALCLEKLGKVMVAKGRHRLSVDVPETDAKRLKYFLDKKFRLERNPEQASGAAEDSYWLTIMADKPTILTQEK